MNAKMEKMQMSNGYNIIGDIAGRYDELMLLLDKMPRDAEVISVGDLIDRGPKSKEVVEWFMCNGKAIMGNHEHLCLDYYNKLKNTPYYPYGCWGYNGGKATLRSFGGVVPDNVLSWMSCLPMYMVVEDCLVSHSFPKYNENLEKACDLGVSVYCRGEGSIIWNRIPPNRIDEYKLQIAGHNSQTGLRWYDDEDGKYALCIDDSRLGRLTGVHLPRGFKSPGEIKFFQQSYLGDGK